MGVCIQPHVSSGEFDALQPLLWVWSRRAIDPGTTLEYNAWWARHGSIPLDDPDVSITTQLFDILDNT